MIVKENGACKKKFSIAYRWPVYYDTPETDTSPWLYIIGADV